MSQNLVQELYQEFNSDLTRYVHSFQIDNLPCQRYEDIIQDVWEKVLIHLTKNKITSKQYFIAWIKKTAKNRFIDLTRLKANKHQSFILGVNDPCIEPSQLDLLEKKEKEGLVQDLINTIGNEKQRKVIKLTYFGGLSHEEISKETGIKTNAVGMYKKRALTTIQKKITLKNKATC